MPNSRLISYSFHTMIARLAGDHQDAWRKLDGPNPLSETRVEWHYRRDDGETINISLEGAMMILSNVPRHGRVSIDLDALAQEPDHWLNQHIEIEDSNYKPMNP